MIAECKVFI